MVYVRSWACRLLRSIVIICLLLQGSVLSQNVADFAILYSGNRWFVWCYGKSCCEKWGKVCGLDFVFTNSFSGFMSEMLEQYLLKNDCWCSSAIGLPIINWRMKSIYNFLSCSCLWGLIGRRLGTTFTWGKKIGALRNERNIEIMFNQIWIWLCFALNINYSFDATVFYYRVWLKYIWRGQPTIFYDHMRSLIYIEPGFKLLKEITMLDMIVMCRNLWSCVDMFRSRWRAKALYNGE